MKIQNCPLCECKLIVNNNTVMHETNMYYPLCHIGNAMPIEVWNRIRIAPDDKPVKYYPGRKNWMNPQYLKADNENS